MSEIFIAPNVVALPQDTPRDVSDVTDYLLHKSWQNGARSFILPYGNTQTEHLYKGWAEGRGKFTQALSRHANHSDSVFINQLDELLGLSATNPRLFQAKLAQILDAANHPNELRNFFNVSANPEDMITEYLARYRKPHVALLGVGPNGHLAYNEPGTQADSELRVQELATSSRQQQAEEFDGFDNTPTHGITLGLKEIFAAEEIIVMACGESKAPVMKRFFEEPTSADLPVSFLKELPRGKRAIIVADQAAMSLIL